MKRIDIYVLSLHITNMVSGRVICLRFGLPVAVEERKVWIKSIPNLTEQVANSLKGNPAVYIRHWPENYPETKSTANGTMRPSLPPYIFDDVAASLLPTPSPPPRTTTTTFMKKVLDMWKVLNVMTINKDIRHRDPLEVVIESVQDPRLSSLQVYICVNMVTTRSQWIVVD